jgi:Fur family ferric uptake transcriptional regulator
MSGARIGLTTVYRHLQKLTDCGTIHAVQTASRQTAYRLCSTTDHHHHLICVGCGAGIEITAAEMDDWVESQATRLGYSNVSHSLEIRGLCPACARPTSVTTGGGQASRAGAGAEGEKGR